MLLAISSKTRQISIPNNLRKFIHSEGCWFFPPFDRILCFTKLFSFMGSYVLILDLSASSIGVLFMKLSLVPKCSRLFPTFFSYHIPFLWVYVEVVYSPGLEFCVGWHIFASFYMQISR